jgi:hypothetical protein
MIDELNNEKMRDVGCGVGVLDTIPLFVILNK